LSESDAATNEELGWKEVEVILTQRSNGRIDKDLSLFLASLGTHLSRGRNVKGKYSGGGNVGVNSSEKKKANPKIGLFV
jgi:hypothetical protein